MITILYSCAQCGIKDRAVQVPARTTEDVRVWVSEIMARVISDDHQSTSPRCMARSMDNVKIPMPKGSEFIGQQIE